MKEIICINCKLAYTIIRNSKGKCPKCGIIWLSPKEDRDVREKQSRIYEAGTGNSGTGDSPFI